MEEKEDKKGGFFSNWIVRNVLLAVLFFAVLIFVSSMLLSVLTNHGKTIEVPDFTSMTVNEAKHEASRSNSEWKSSTPFLSEKWSGEPSTARIRNQVLK